MEMCPYHSSVSTMQSTTDHQLTDVPVAVETHPLTKRRLPKKPNKAVKTLIDKLPQLQYFSQDLRLEMTKGSEVSPISSYLLKRMKSYL